MLRFFVPNLRIITDFHPLQVVPNLITLAQLVVRLLNRHEVVVPNPCR